MTTQVRTDYAALAEEIGSRFEQQTPASAAQYTRAQEILPLGVSGAAKWYAPYPVYLASANGGHVTDVDGRRYVDLLMGAGPCILGHGHPRVMEAVERQLRKIGQVLAPTTLEEQYAARLRQHMPYLERIRFTNTGSEAVRTCLRAARAITGRSAVAKCEGTYHGSDDPFLFSTATVAGPAADPVSSPESAGIPTSVADEVMILPFNRTNEAVELIRRRAESLAAVFIEPVAFSTGGALPMSPAFVRAIRDVTRELGILLVFDEVVTGFRLGLGGAPGYLGVTPDLSAIGKAVGGGLPLAAMGGTADVMDAVLGPRSVEQGMRIFQSGTFTGHPLSLAAGMATLDVLEEEPVLEKIDRLGERLRQGLRDVLGSAGLPATVTGLASVFQLHFQAEEPRDRRDIVANQQIELTRLFLLGLVTEGVLWPPIHPGLTAYAHSDADVDEVIEAAGRVAQVFAGRVG